MSGPEVMVAAGLSCLLAAAVIALIREVTNHRCKWVVTYFQAPTFDDHGQKIEVCACGAIRASWRKLLGDWNIYIETHPSPVQSKGPEA